MPKSSSARLTPRSFARRNVAHALATSCINALSVISKQMRSGRTPDERKASIDEMHHAESLMERILFLEGLPNLQDLHKLLIGESVQECLSCDLKLELAAHPLLKDAIADCERCGDYVSRDLFRRIMDSEEEHIDWLETQLDLIDKVGVENYQQSQMKERS